MAKRAGANAENFAATNAAILKAATRLFVEHGYDATTTTEIVAAAGIAQGSLYYHFKTKRDLFIAAHNALQLELLARLEKAASGAKDSWTRFEKMWRGYLAATAEPAVRRVLLLDGPRVIGLENLRAQDRDTAFAAVREAIEAMMAEGFLERGDARALACLLFGALDQAAFEIADFPNDARLRKSLIESMGGLMASLRLEKRRKRR
jgi:AcrR family transcriptional regulator